MPCCVCGVRAAVCVQRAVVGAVWDVVRVCRACVFVCCVRLCAVLCDTCHDATSVRCCVAVLLCFRVCVALRLIGRSLWLSAAVVAQQLCNPGDAQEFDSEERL